ncbi:MFS transporter [Macrococcus sp. EM39E]|uniref:MFS transporter n=1 Tax=Macrococcus animalis TaxID=3395467 RepID=UPI0039BE2F7D
MEKELKESFRQMYLLILSTMIASLGISIYSFGISFYILSATGSAKLFSINLAMSVLGRIVVTPLSGYLADNYNRKKVIFWSIFIEAMLVLFLLIYIHFLGFNIIVLYIVTFLAAFISSASSPSFMASIPHIVHNEHLQKTMGYNSTASSLSMLLGPVLGGLLYGFVSKELFLIIFIIAYIIASLVILMINFELYKKKVDNEIDEKIEKESIIKSFKFGLKYIWHHDILRTLLILFMSLNFFVSGLNIGMSKIIIGHFKASSEMMGILEASFSIGVLIGGIVVGSKKKFKNPFPVLKIGLLLEGVFLIIISVPLLLMSGLWPVYITFFIVGLLLGITAQFVNTPMFVFFQEFIDEQVQGRVFSVINLTAQLLMPVSYILFGIIFDQGLYGITFLICGVSCIVLVLSIMNQKFNVKTTRFLSQASS